MYVPMTPSGAGTSYGGARAAGMSATRGEAEQLPTLPSNTQVPVRPAIGGRTQYQSMVGPSSRQGEWQSGFPRMASAPDSSHNGTAGYMDDAAPYSPANGTSDVPATLLAPPASAAVSPTPYTSHPLIDVQPDPKRPEHADPLRPWLVPRGKLSKAQRIRTFIAERAAAAGDHSWPRQCPHADCRERAEWEAGSRAQEPSYPSEKALVRHIERCGDERCEFCLEDGGYFGRPALAQLHRAGIDHTACKVIAACGGVRNIVGIYAWLEKYCTPERIEQVVASYQLGKKGRKGDPFGKYLKDMHEDIMRGNAAARTLVNTARVTLDAEEIPAFEDQYSMPA
ncbi:hypothetical protein EXIGLDRAFT_123134 [Exidia glandulosa HHB12029]|uniref:Uncharacterized protein n=1 Tax=Exidia glandulosa HHB12029 TaxID=1314781 RepID=A0A165NIY9_EXIGL|nr:hypothetical protein EXIGLDRAFT_123134 [Exidia glandulosa HHB12029]